MWGAGPEVGWTHVGLPPRPVGQRLVGPPHTHTQASARAEFAQFLRCFPAGRATRHTAYSPPAQLGLE